MITIRKRIILAAVIAVTLFAWQDVLLWQRIFERDQLWQYVGTYHDGWRVTLDALSFVVLIALWGRWLEIAFFIGTIRVMSITLVGDVLYYWLDGRSLPTVLPWMNDNAYVWFKPVTAGALLSSSTIWVVAWIAVWGATVRLCHAESE